MANNINFYFSTWSVTIPDANWYVGVLYVHLHPHMVPTRCLISAKVTVRLFHAHVLQRHRFPWDFADSHPVEGRRWLLQPIGLLQIHTRQTVFVLKDPLSRSRVIHSKMNSAVTTVGIAQKYKVSFHSSEIASPVLCLRRSVVRKDLFS